MRKIIFITTTILVLLAALFVFFVLPILRSKNTVEEPTPISSKTISSLQRVKLGTPEGEIKNLPEASKSALPDGHEGYALPSELKSRPNFIVVQNGISTFERELTPVNPSTPGYLTISMVKKDLGEPEKIINGSNYYGSFLSTFIYSSQGIAVVANQNTGEVYEVQFFQKQTPSEYLKNFGQDVNPNTKNPSESF